MRRAFRRLLNPDPSIDWLQPLPKERPVDRRALLLELAAGKRVVHLGFTDERQTEAKLRQGRWLHASLNDVARELVGLDVDEPGVRGAQADGHEAYIVDVRDGAAVAELALEPAELVIAGEIIEHLDAPGPFLEAVKPLLAANGRLVVTTPNAYRAAGFLAPILGSELIHPDHVGIHSIHTLRTLGERAGYRIERLGYYQNAPQLSRSAAGMVARVVRSLQRLAPHWSDGIFAVYTR